MRTCGILMPIFSLPSPYGIGTFGKEAFNFIDFLSLAGQTYWQILPLNPTNYGDSPYQSFSCFAGNPYFIDLDLLIESNLLTKKEVDRFDFGENAEQIDYGKLYENRFKVLNLAFKRFRPDNDYFEFVKANSFWLEDYCLFMAIKNANNDSSWLDWEKPLRCRESSAILQAKDKYAENMDFHRFIQYEFYIQWRKLRKYANSKGIKIIGDIPIYVAMDSADVWANPSLFLLNEDLSPKAVAGCPPDTFSKDGQLWGNPLYDWDKMKNSSYSWWKSYLGNAMQRYDLTRIDHFRAFESFFAIPYGDKTARNGKWIKGPGMDLFDSVQEEFGENLPIIAEDLGHLTPEVIKLLEDTGFAGMKVLQFAFSTDAESNYLPHNHNKNSVVYTGTHDNDTIMGWLKSAPEREVKYARRYLNHTADDGFNWAMMRSALMSPADTCILMMADIIGLGTEARINTPSTSKGNWIWRIKGECINEWLASVVKEETEIYCRLPKKKL